MLTLKARSVKFAREAEGDGGYRMATIEDPEGNRINLYEYVRST